MSAIITYRAPPIIRAFIKDYRPASLFYSWIVGPVGSGKTTAIFMKLVYMAKMQAPSPDGIRRTRAVIVRNTMPQLKDTTLKSWDYWFKDGQAGHWNATDKIFTLRFDDVECEVLFRPLDTQDDISRVLSLEVNFAIVDEFVDIPKAIIDALSARVGRYRQPDGTPVSVWGLWGSSNPSTEDNWWFDYLHGEVRRHDESEAAYRARRLITDPTKPVDVNATYFKQPSGLAADAENIENVPGKRTYYTEVVKGRSKQWIKQFVEAEWGYSSAGQAVVSGFRPEMHVPKEGLKYNPLLPLIIGCDPGITGSALIFMQEDYSGRIVVLRELIQRGYGIERIVKERLLPVLKNEYPDCEIGDIVIALDPAGANRSSNDERTAKKILEDLGFKVWCETNNRFPLRLGAYEHYVSTLAEGQPALQIDPFKCPVYIRALKGGWRYANDVKKDILKGVDPEKNEYSHPGDAGGYGLRYFHKGQIRFEKFGVRGRVPIPPPAARAPRYHWR